MNDLKRYDSTRFFQGEPCSGSPAVSLRPYLLRRLARTAHQFDESEQ